jgi:AFG3 family protein
MAARKDKSFVSKDDFESASERVIGGLEKTKKLSKEEREIVATHESGHAVASWFLEGADPLLKVSILPRSKGALGFAQFLPNETALHSKEELMDKICAVLAGRAAEEIFFQRVTTGAQDDLLKATQIAHAIVTTLGMNERLGMVGYAMDTEAFNKPFSEDTSTIIDEEVRTILIEGLAKARNLLESKRDLVGKLRDQLLEKERLVQKDLVDVLGPRPFELSAEHEKYVNEGQSK